MARVGRASRNASLMRVETVTTATKACAAAESGEIYLIDKVAGCTLTLPPLKAGAYVKIIVADLMTGDLVVQGATTTDYMVGCVPVRTADAGHDGTVSVVAAKGTTKDILTVTADNGIHEGSWIELVSDGSVWFLTGCVIGADEGTTAVVA
jgi:hypothetical protein